MSDISIQDLLQDLVTRSLPKISMRDLYYRSSLQDLFARPLSGKALMKCFSSLQDFFPKPVYEKSLHKSSLQDLFGLFTGTLYKISSQDLYERSLYKSSLQDLFTRPLWESLQDLFARPLWEIQDLFTGPPYETSLYKSSLQSVFTSPKWDVATQDLLISLDLLGLFTRALYRISSQEIYESSLYKSSLQDPFTRPLWKISKQELSTRSLHKTSMRDLFTRALYKISSQDLYERSLHKSSRQDLFTGPHMRHLYTRSPVIPGLSRSPHRSSLQDLVTRPLWGISIQELSTRSLHRTPYETSLHKISWYPWTF